MPIEKIFNRTGPAVVPVAGDYTSDLITSDSGPEPNVKLAMDAVVAKASVGGVALIGDLGPGPSGETRVTGIQGRAISPVAPREGERLTWSATANHWAPKPTGAAAPVLLPAGWKNPVCQYSLFVNATGDGWEPERSGSGFDVPLASVGVMPFSSIPDRVPGKQALYTSVSGSHTRVGIAAGNPKLDLLRNYGAMTAIVRISNGGRANNYEGVIFGFGDPDVEGLAGNICWELTLDPNSGGLRYWHNYDRSQNGGGYWSPFADTMNYRMPYWSVVSLRRRVQAPWVVSTIGCNKVYVSGMEDIAPRNGEGGTLNFGAYFSGALYQGLPSEFNGGIADFSFFDRELTDAEVDEATDIMLG